MNTHTLGPSTGFLPFFKAFFAFFGVKPALVAIFFIAIYSHAASAMAATAPAATQAAPAKTAKGAESTQSAQTPYTVTDAAGRQITFQKPPQRIITLLPSLAETICVLGACERLVGRDRYTIWPPELVRRVPAVGGGLDPNIEAVVALRPDVVMVSTTSRVSERLRALGLRVVMLEPKTHVQVHQSMRITAQVLGLPTAKADALWQQMNARINHTAANMPAELRGKRVYFEVSRGPYAAGESSFIGETIARLKLGNVVDKSMGPFPKLNPEFVVLKNPDFIMAGDRSAGELLFYPGWKNLDAVKSERFCLFTVAQIDVLIHPGPRMDESAQLISDCVQGKLKAQSRRKPQPVEKR